MRSWGNEEDAPQRALFEGMKGQLMIAGTVLALKRGHLKVNATNYTLHTQLKVESDRNLFLTNYSAEYLTEYSAETEYM